MLPTQQTLSPAVRERNTAMNWLLTEFPLAFNLGDRKPLKEHILADIESSGRPDIPPSTALIAALQYYMNWGSYLKSLKAGAQRVDLNGATAGLVDDKAEAEALAALSAAQEKCS